MFSKLLAIFRIPELRQKIILTLILLAVYRMGFLMPLPFVDHLDVAAERKHCDHPLRPVGAILAADQRPTEPDREAQDLHAERARNEVVAELVNEDQ